MAAKRSSRPWYKRRYQVIFIDEYNNFYEIGWYDDLEKAEKDVNKYLESYTVLDDDGNESDDSCFGGAVLGKLVEYSGTFGPVFDRVIDTPEGSVQVRGFVRN